MWVKTDTVSGNERRRCSSSYIPCTSGVDRGGGGGSADPSFRSVDYYVIAITMRKCTYLVLGEANKLCGGAANRSLCINSSVHTVKLVNAAK